MKSARLRKAKCCLLYVESNFIHTYAYMYIYVYTQHIYTHTYIYVERKWKGYWGGRVLVGLGARKMEERRFKGRVNPN